MLCECHTAEVRELAQYRIVGHRHRQHFAELKRRVERRARAAEAERRPRRIAAAGKRRQPLRCSATTHAAFFEAASPAGAALQDPRRECQSRSLETARGHLHLARRSGGGQRPPNRERFQPELPIGAAAWLAVNSRLKPRGPGIERFPFRETPAQGNGAGCLEAIRGILRNSSFKRTMNADLGR